jgi:hypothetical protein
MPIQMHAPRHILDGHCSAQPADLHRETQRVLGVVRQKIELLVSHAASMTGHAMHLKIEIDLPIPAPQIAQPPPAFIVTATARLPAPAADGVFERRSSVIPTPAE